MCCKYVSIFTCIAVILKRGKSLILGATNYSCVWDCEPYELCYWNQTFFTVLWSFPDRTRKVEESILLGRDSDSKKHVSLFSESVSSVIPCHVEIGTSLTSRIMLIVPYAIITVSSNDKSRGPQKNTNCFLSVASCFQLFLSS